MTSKGILGSSRRVSFFAVAAGLAMASSAWAFRNAQFPDELKNQTTLFTREIDFFKTEPTADQSRPIWVHGGDSLSVAWGSRDSLRDLLNGKATQGELPIPGSFIDLVQHMPSQDWSWHSGRQLGFGFLNWLQTDSQQKWVVVSTALAGTLLDESDFDPLQLMEQTVHPDRVKLITFSLGANDVCDDHAPTDDMNRLNSRLDAFKDSFAPDTTIVPWTVPDVKSVRANILARLATVPDSVAKQRVLNYCLAAWEHHCPNAKAATADRIAAIRDPLIKVYEDKFGKTFNVFDEVMQSTPDPLDQMSSDCFHPSRDVQEGIYKALAKHLKTYYRLSTDVRSAVSTPKP